MTLKELLLSVNFGTVAETFKKMYPKNAEDVFCLKFHYDILCNTTPAFDPNADSQVCRISKERNGITAFSLEGDLWPSSLCKTIEIDSDVEASLEEIAACCLWHTSFYGYTEKQLTNTAEGFSNEWRDKNDLEIYQQKLSRNLKDIERLYNYIPTLPSLKDVYKDVKSSANERYKIYRGRHIKKRIQNRWFRREFIKAEYYRYLYDISRFILEVKTPDESIEGLCTFFMFKKIIVYNYRSYTYGKSDPAKYLRELIEIYDAFDKTYQHVYICLVSANENNSNLTESERQLCFSIISSCSDFGLFYVITKYDSSLVNEMRMIVAFYE